MKAKSLLTRILWLFALVLIPACVTTHQVVQDGPAFASDNAFRHWFTYYYQDPHPESLTSAMRYMQAEGYLDENIEENRDMPLIASVFLARVMRDHKADLKLWSASWQKLGQQEWYVLMVSLYMADVPEAKQVLAANLNKVDAAHRSRLVSMQKVPPATLDPLTGPVVSERQINLLWAGFSATGDMLYVRKVIGAVPLYGDESEQKATIGELALMSLATNALQNDDVAHECSEANGRTTDKKTKMLLTAMLAAVKDIARNEQRDHDAISH